jgi:hypothetical protein
MAQAYPDGIEARHGGDGNHAFTRWIGLAVLGIFLALGLSGRLGGWNEGPRSAERAGMSLSIEMPTTLRSGQVFEIWVKIEGDRPIDKPTIAFFAPYMRNLTINTVMPEGAEHTYAGEAFMLGYDRLDAGKPLQVKLDGQVNPTLGGGHDGWVELRDGETPLVRIPLEQEILP